MKTFRAAVVGTGFIGPVHVEALRRAEVDVAAIVGSSPEKSHAAAQRLGVDPRHASLDDVLADESIDAVHLTTPNRFHFEQASAALRAGKHVLCEKPLSMNSRESEELTSLAADCDLAAGVAYNIRFYPLCREAADRVRSGSLGKVLHVTGSYVQDWLLHASDFNWRVLAEDCGELRSVADIGTHWLDLIQFITGQRIVSVCADLQTVHKRRQRPTELVETFSGKMEDSSRSATIDIATDDAGCVMLRFDNGAHGCLWVSQTTAGRKNCLRFEVAGSSQTFAWNSEAPNCMWIGHRDRPNESLIRDPALLGQSAAAVSSFPGGHNEGFSDTFKQLFRRFYAYIAAGDMSAPPTFPTFSDGHREILLCEAILRSHRNRSWVDVEEAE
ncbi:MAG: Gfo/Idh/MocA family oxidoreductase [Pirellulales bacterium]|nr:Gfo/Idh/MocA family oxidoreductase [Pirellulales bacterium]